MSELTTAAARASVGAFLPSTSGIKIFGKDPLGKNRSSLHGRRALFFNFLFIYLRKFYLFFTYNHRRTTPGKTHPSN